MSLSKFAQRILRHTCYCHPRKHSADDKENAIPHFDLSEGRMIRNGTLFICHGCANEENARLGRRLADKSHSPAEGKIERALTGRGYRFEREFKLGNFEFDFALPSVRVLVEIDGRTYHRHSDYEDETEDQPPPTPGTKRYAAQEAGWTLVRVRNGVRLVDRFFRKVTQAVAVVKT